MLRLVVLCSVAATALSFSSGPPKSTCKTRSPDPSDDGHGAQPQKKDSCPFSVTAEAWRAGQETTLTLSALDSAKTFKGYLISVENSKGELIGQVNPTLVASKPKDQKPKVVCDGTSLGHSEGDEKSSITLAWKAPADLAANEKVTVTYTVVESKDTYWVDCNRLELTSAQSLTAPDGGLNPDVLAAVAVDTTTAAALPQTTTQAVTTTEIKTQAPTTTETTTLAAATTTERATQAITATAAEITTHAAAPAETTTLAAAPTETTTQAAAPTETTTQAAAQTEITTHAAAPTETTPQTEPITAGIVKVISNVEITAEVKENAEIPIGHPGAADTPLTKDTTEELKARSLVIEIDGMKTAYYCRSYGNLYILIPGQDCGKFFQLVDTKESKLQSSLPMSCAKATQFNTNLCTCVTWGAFPCPKEDQEKFYNPNPTIPAKPQQVAGAVITIVDGKVTSIGKEEPVQGEKTQAVPVTTDQAKTGEEVAPVGSPVVHP